MSPNTSKAVRPPDPFDWNAIADRYFDRYGDRPQAELMELFGASQAQISHWKTRKERIPFRVLAKWVELDGVTWDWILAGVGPTRRRVTVKAAPVAPKPGGKQADAAPALKSPRPRRKSSAE